ncbi:DUF2290 domain-containing protein [Trinickia symbiotica]|uniref:DUF2290 domain-containing protein n=1 Tax=Trinickia symbiotica TaxID=863227 RepID=A0A2T3XP87_9BURK|nr:DUF2290 domain-containing protein [Trinickia symbiotica]
MDEQNFPSVKNFPERVTQIGLGAELDLSLSLRNISYKEIYSALDHAGAFNVRMLDGALIQMFYSFTAGVLTSHRLAYFPSPSLEAYQNEPEIYEDDYIYADILAKNIVAFPIRFDFDVSEKLFRPVLHPRSHLTLGQYKNCRIPVTAPLSPIVFVKFILNNLYATAARAVGDLGITPTHFQRNIHPDEERVPHVRLQE